MKQKSSLAPLILSFLSFFLIGIGSASVFLFQSPLQDQQFDTRNAASVDTGMVLLSSSPASGTTIDPAQPVPIYLQVNTQGVQVDGVQLTFKVTTTASELVVNPVENSGIQITTAEIEKVSDGYLVSMMALPTGSAATFSSTSATNIGKLLLSKFSGGTTQITFDNSNSKSLVHGSDPIRDELKTMPVFSFTVLASVTASPSPSPSTQQCNKSCSVNSDCGSNYRCYQTQCRLAVNPTSTTCVAQPDQGLQRTCNQYCADTKECASGYTCFSNRCRKPENPDSATCGQVSGTVTQAMNKSCNVGCSSNKECGVNLRCYNGSCRLATNPGSTTCSATNQSTVSSYYGKGSKGASDGSENLPSTISAKPVASPTTGTGAYKPPTPNSNNEGVLSGVTNFFNNLLHTIEGQGISFPALAVGIGIILLILAILATLLGRRKKSGDMPPVGPSSTSFQSNMPNRAPSPMDQAPKSTGPTLRPAAPTPAVPPVTQNKPATPPTSTMSSSAPGSARSTNEEYQKTLQARIAELRNEKAAAATASSSNAAPVMPSVSQTPAAPAQAVTMGTQPPSSSMMDRLKQKQVMDKMPNPTEQ